MRGGYYKIPPIRPELQAAYDEGVVSEFGK